ncbi:MAG: transcription termination/antitermination protein NusA [Patescibacteria group bacterium]|jgi:N utilization substance protein A|nr:transcription termination/antitermination protein NusA [Patescibacteria group bacterium]
MQSQFVTAIEQICEEKGISKDSVIEAIEAALIAAYKKDFGDKDQEVRVTLDNDTGEARIFVSKEVVKEVQEGFEMLQISLADASKLDSKAKLGEMVEYEEDNKEFGRVAAQTAKQVIMQRIREAEREVVFSEFSDKEGQIISSTVQRVERGNVYIDLGHAVGVLFPNDQLPNERYYTGQRVKVYVVRVEQTQRGPQIVVSRTHPEMIRRLFEMEVPEISNDSVEIVAIAREAGMRTKIAVKSNIDGVDPVGTFVGGRGSRVQAVMNEIGEEKIDIIPYSEDPVEYISSALSPTKVISVKVDDDEKKAVVKVPEDQLSLAIGKSGQNVRLAAKLTGWNVDIDGADESGIEETAEAVQDEPKTIKTKDLEESLISAATTTETDSEGSKEKTTEESSKKEVAEESEDDNDKNTEDQQKPEPKGDIKD